MSAHVFCPSCGTKNEPLNGRKPNFCTSCGHNFQSLAVFGGGQPAPSRRPAVRQDTNDDLDIRSSDENDVLEGAEISLADVEIVKDTRNKITVGAIAGTRKPGTIDEGDRQAITHQLGKKVNTKKAFEAFAEEAGKGGVKRVEVG